MKTVLITGANKSIGFETARQMARMGFYVYLGSRDEARGEAAAYKLHQEGLKNVEAIIIDVSSMPSVQAARRLLGAKTDTLDVLINNAGISGGFPQPPLTASVDMIRSIFDTNFFDTIQVIQAFMDLLKTAAVPTIVNVTSGLASLTLHADPTWKYYNAKGAGYGPSKTALNAYTVALAFELRDTNFKINAVDPGFTATDFNQHRGTRHVTEAAAEIVKYAVLDHNGPTGKYFSTDNNPETGLSPW